MKTAFPDLPDWTFETKEVSAGVYEITGINTAGHRVSAKGTELELDRLIEQCKKEARQASK
jgi:hypothetical protein